MSYAENPYSSWGGFAAGPGRERTQFIRKTYVHLIGAVLGFVGIEAVLIEFATGRAHREPDDGSACFRWLLSW